MYFFLDIYSEMLFLFSNLKNSFIDKLVISYTIGISLIIAEFVLLYKFTASSYFYYICSIITICSIIYIIKKTLLFRANIIKNKSDNFSVLIFIAFSVILFLYTFLMVTSAPFPSKVDHINYHQDLLWQIGNISSFIIHFPPKDIHVDGLIFRYHYFNELFLAASKAFTNISSFELKMYYSNFYHLIFLILALFAFSNRFLKIRKSKIFFMFSFFIVGSAPLFLISKKGTSIWKNNYLHHNLSNVNSVTIATIYLLLLVCITIDFSKYKKIPILPFVGLLLLFTSLVGFKGPFALLFLGTFLIINIIMLFMKRQISSFILLLIFFSFIFLFLYYSLFHGGVNTIELNPINSNSTIMRSFFGLFLTLVHNNTIKLLLIIILIPFHLFLLYPFQILPYFINTFNKIKNIPPFDFNTYFIHGLAFAGIIPFYLFAHHGMSQLYFIFCSLPFINIIAIQYFDKNIISLHWFYKCTLILGIFSSLCTATFYIKHGIVQSKKIHNYSISNKRNESDNNVITNNEYDGLIWLKNNSKVNEIFSCNRHYSTNGSDFQQARYYYYTAFSERQAFIEGYAYSENSGLTQENAQKLTSINNHFYEIDYKNKYALAKKYNISYIVVSQFVNPEFIINEPNIIKIFNNSDITIYKIL